MDHSWRPRPPPPQHFSPNPRFQFPPPPPNQFVVRPPIPPPPAAAAAYDPLVDHHGGPPMHPHRPMFDGFEDRHHPRPWIPSPNFTRDSNGSLSSSFDHGNAGVKRMRIEDSSLSLGGSSPFMNEKSSNLSRFTMDDERRLKLIHDHGAANRELDKVRDGFQGVRNGDSSFTDPGCGNLDRKGTFYEQELVLNEQKYGDKRSGVNQYQSGYHEVDSNMLPKNGYGYNNYNNLEHDRQSQEGTTCSSTLGDGYQSRHGVLGMDKLHYEHRSNVPVDYHRPNSESYGMQNHMEPKSNHYDSPYRQGSSGPSLYPSQGSNGFAYQPPLPASPPPPLPMEPPGRPHVVSSAPPSSYPPPPPEVNSMTYFPNKGTLHSSAGSATEERQVLHYSSSQIYLGESEQRPIQHLSSDKSKFVDASHILKHPHRATRPDHLVIILRGLPGSGKSYLAKMLRDLEIENGGTAPRIHSMDDYFMTEVEKVEEREFSKSSGSVRGKNMVTKKVMEYCYEPEMEEAYRSSMLKAFKKTLDEGNFSFIIVDDRNLRVADFAQFWATAKRSGYEVYLLEATYKDPAGCAARNVHGFTQDEIQKMAGQWEEAPSMYMKLDIKSLLHGDDLEEDGIQEVDMDLEDSDPVGVPSSSVEGNIEKVIVASQGDISFDGYSKDEQEWGHEVDHPTNEVKELGKSKWSSDLDEDLRRSKGTTKSSNALSGLIQSYSKRGKTVRWGDQVTKRGFSIGASKATNVSLVIGPGAGYNLNSNPLPEQEKSTLTQSSGEPKRRNIFQERLRAEQESFRAVFESFRTGIDKRRQRIIGLDAENE